MIRTDCYLAVLKKYKEQYPTSIFKVITRTSHSVLSPSWKLLNKAKQEKWDFEKYREEFIQEKRKLFETKNPEFMPFRREINELRMLNYPDVNIFLVCYEKDASICHRTIIKEIIENKEILGV